MSAAAAGIAVLIRELRLASRNRGDLYVPLLFFAFVVVLFPLGTAATSDLLMHVGAAIIWVAALFASMLSLDRIFRSDFEDGSLEQLLLSPHPTSVLIGAKVLAHWLTSGLWLLLLSPLLALAVGLSRAIPELMLTLALGTPILSLVGAIGVALTVGLPRGGMLLSVLVLPLYTPTLIFAANAVSQAAAGQDITAQLYFLAAMLVLAITLAPIAASAALRVSME